MEGWKVRYWPSAMLMATIKGVHMRLKGLIKCILFPVYRRSSQIVRYIDEGYSHKEALAKVKVIEV